MKAELEKGIKGEFARTLDLAGQISAEWPLCSRERKRCRIIIGRQTEKQTERELKVKRDRWREAARGNILEQCNPWKLVCLKLRLVIIKYWFLWQQFILTGCAGFVVFTQNPTT